MAKVLTFNFEGKEYTLEYTRNSVATMERQGFNLNDIETKPMITLPKLFAGAFLAHHSGIKQEKINNIFDHITNKAELTVKLAEMYNDPIATLVDDPEEKEGNISWEANW